MDMIPEPVAFEFVDLALFFVEYSLLWDIPKAQISDKTDSVCLSQTSITHDRNNTDMNMITTTLCTLPPLN